MMSQISQAVVLAFGGLICILALWGIVVPSRMMQFIQGVADKDWGIHLAVVIRIVLGAALILVAADSRFPLVFEVLGWIAIAAAVMLLFMGRGRLRKIVAWFVGMPQAMIRVWLLFAVAFGALLIYGVV